MTRETTRDTTRTWAEISLGNLEHNYRDLRACAPDSKFLGTVKANGYGHGAIPVARRLVELGTDYLAVACLDEAAALRAAGITARIAEGETVLEYDGAGLSLGLLDGAGLTPVSAVTAMMEQIEKGYMAKCAWSGEEGQYLQVSFQDPELEANTGTQFLLTFDRNSHALLSAEVSVAGTTVLTAQISNFTTELIHDDAGVIADLG